MSLTAESLFGILQLNIPDIGLAYLLLPPSLDRSPNYVHNVDSDCGCLHKNMKVPQDS
jgi:hypothetical protein